MCLHFITKVKAEYFFILVYNIFITDIISFEYKSEYMYTGTFVSHLPNTPQIDISIITTLHNCTFLLPVTHSKPNPLKNVFPNNLFN